ncbi:MAG: dicarboxylate/amino acid:cation symporter [Prevotellaceae bacterium]|jgi:Na+/H+-dicarboxylate symporter|nr:dicarboxylate/amino acid:cation symporter [Prevotellaceae bacterium]
MTKTGKKLSVPLYMQILFGMITGILIGIIALQFNGERFVQDWIYPWGRLFIRLLQLIAIPLIFVTLVKGLTGLKDIRDFSRMGGKALVLYLATSMLAVLLGLSMGLLVKPGNLVDKTRVEHIREEYRTVAAEKELAAEQSKNQGPLSFINDIVPDNVFDAATSNSRMLQVIFFALFFGVAALTIKSDKIQPVINLFDGLNDIILRMVDYIILLAPYGVVALMAGLITDFKGDISIFSALAVYALVLVFALLLLMFFFYPLIIHLFTGIKVRTFLKAIYPVQLFAFTTSSSAATLPLTMNVVEKKLGVSQATASFILPVGATVNMDGTSCYQTVAVLFIAQILSIDLTVGQLLIVVGMCILSSIGTPGIPGGSFVILTIVLTSVGIPAEGLALILGIDRPLDMLRTSVNVTGDAVVAAIIDKNHIHDRKKTEKQG